MHQCESFGFDLTILVGRGYKVAKTFECFVVEWVQGYVDLAIVVVPVNVDFDIFCSFGVHRDIAVVRVNIKWLASMWEV